MDYEREFDVAEIDESEWNAGGITLTATDDEGTDGWKVYLPPRTADGNRLLLISDEQFEVISMVLTMEAFTEPQYSPFPVSIQNELDNLITPNGLFHSPTPIHQCPDCQSILIPLGDKHWVCDRCAVTLDADFEMVALIEDEDWIEMDPMTMEFDMALSIVRDDDMNVLDDPYGVTEEGEARQAYEDHGGPNHSNHDLFEVSYYCNDDGHLLTPTGQGYYHCPECDWKGFISDEDVELGRFQDKA